MIGSQFDDTFHQPVDGVGGVEDEVRGGPEEGFASFDELLHLGQGERTAVAGCSRAFYQDGRWVIEDGSKSDAGPSVKSGAAKPKAKKKVAAKSAVAKKKVAAKPRAKKAVTGGE